MTHEAKSTLDEAACLLIANRLQLTAQQVATVIELFAAGNTVPFIARYRKERTGGLDEVALRAIEDAFEAWQTLTARKQTVLKTIAEQGLLTPALRDQIERCTELAELEVLYLPFKPKRRTRATIAREQGLQPLADRLLSSQPWDGTRDKLLRQFVDPTRGVADTAAALQGALDIVAEQWSEDAAVRTSLTQEALGYGRFASHEKRGNKQDTSKFESYLQHAESVKTIPSHRILAMLRGEAEGILKLALQLDDERIVRRLKSQLVRDPKSPFYQDLLGTVDDCYARLLQPATESWVMQQLKAKADEEAIAVFGKNLRELLMAPPAGPRVTLGIDPGFRTGCKVAVVDETGKFLRHVTIYPTAPHLDVKGAERALATLIKEHHVELIAIGNGTASRETMAFVNGMLKEHKLSEAISCVMVSEAGASIYSASELAATEFPDLDLTIRGAISIARRLQDPLAELVKTDPKSIGVGQYQHDVNQSQLRKCLDRVVESCVNHVGVDLNTASVPLLSAVAGIGPKLALNIVEYRNTNGRFLNRKQLMSVPKLGKKAFEQAAGFLRIRGGDEPLDNSAVHPESYPIVTRMATALATEVRALVGNPSLTSKLDAARFVDAQVGLPTVTDIIAELAKPGRDPRRQFQAVRFDEQVTSLEQLRTGMVMEGVITNVTHFGAFVDLGVHQDGLIHISQLADTFVSDTNEVVSVGDITRVKVLEIDLQRKRIALTRKF